MFEEIYCDECECLLGFAVILGGVDGVPFLCVNCIEEEDIAE